MPAESVGWKSNRFISQSERERERGQFRFISFQFDRKSNAMSNNEHKKTERKLFGSLWSCSSTKTRINIHQFHGQPTCNILRAAKLMVLRCNEISDSKLFAICVFVCVLVCLRLLELLTINIIAFIISLLVIRCY